MAVSRSASPPRALALPGAARYLGVGALLLALAFCVSLLGPPPPEADIMPGYTADQRPGPQDRAKGQGGASSGAALQYCNGSEAAACVMCCGHRGARRRAPENTLPSFLAALELGANCVELDMHRTRDGQLAVVHGRTAAQMTLVGVQEPRGTLPALVEDMTWQHVEKLDAGAWQGKDWAGLRVPSFEALLEHLWDRAVTLVVELKVTPEKQAPAASGCASRARGGTAGATAAWEPLFADNIADFIEGRSPRRRALVHSQVADEAPTKPGSGPEPRRPGLGSAGGRGQARRRLGSRGSSPPRFRLLFSSFNHILVDALADRLGRIMASQAKGGSQGHLMGAVAGVAYIYGPNSTICDAHIQETKMGLPAAKEGAAVGAPPAVPAWLALHDSLLPAVWGRQQRVDGLRVLTWVTDELDSLASQVQKGVRGTVTNTPDICPQLCSTFSTTCPGPVVDVKQAGAG